MSPHLASPFVLLLAGLLLACGASAPQTGPQPEPLALAEQGAWRMELLAPAPLAVGQNRVLYRLLRDGQPITQAQLTQRPLMQMTTTQHACPLQDPPEQANAEGLFEGLLVFTMPSSDEGDWTLSVDVQADGDGAPSTLDFGTVNVGDSAAKKVVSRDSQKIILTAGFTAPPQVGENELVVTAHVARDMTMMEYVPVQDLSFVITPEMPSMGHGSSGNVDPVLSEDGLYRGTAVFSMAGDWVLHLEVRAQATSLGTYDFAYEL